MVKKKEDSKDEVFGLDGETLMPIAEENKPSYTLANMPNQSSEVVSFEDLSEQIKAVSEASMKRLMEIDKKLELLIARGDKKSWRGEVNR